MVQIWGRGWRGAMRKALGGGGGIKGWQKGGQTHNQGGRVNGGANRDGAKGWKEKGVKVVNMVKRVEGERGAGQRGGGYRG